MTSNKQKRKEIQLKRSTRRAYARETAKKLKYEARRDTAPVNESLLLPINSYGAPPYVQRGFYIDQPFTCKDCGHVEVWLATQQKWWYEIAKGYPDSHAVRCRACRRRLKQHRKDSMEGMEKKRVRRGKGHR